MAKFLFYYIIRNYSSKRLMRKIMKSIKDTFSYLNNHVITLNNSKFFAGLMIITLNISSKFVNLNLSKTVESYLRYTFSKHILVFAMAWMGTRDIYIALMMTIIFIICFEYLFNENSPYCCLPESFTEYHKMILEENNVTNDQIKQAIEVLEKAKQNIIIKT